MDSDFYLMNLKFQLIIRFHLMIKMISHQKDQRENQTHIF